MSRYAYHHGYFDGEEREFRGFGMVEQFDTEKFATLIQRDTLPDAANLDETSHVPPVLTRTWFHTGVFFDRERVSHGLCGGVFSRTRIDRCAGECVAASRHGAARRSFG